MRLQRHRFICRIFFFNDTATTEIYTLSLHDALPICVAFSQPEKVALWHNFCTAALRLLSTSTSSPRSPDCGSAWKRSEEHTSELQSRQYLVCRLLLEKKTEESSLSPSHSL